MKQIIVETEENLMYKFKYYKLKILFFSIFQNPDPELHNNADNDKLYDLRETSKSKLQKFNFKLKLLIEE